MEIATRNVEGVPAAQFIENVEEFITTQNTNADQVLQNLQTLYSKYKFLEMKLHQARAGLKTKIPEIKKTLESVKLLHSKEGDEVYTNFSLSENVYAKAKLNHVGSVCLWLGANVMTEYTFEEAIALLEKNVRVAEENLKKVEEDVCTLRDFVTTTEVNIARVYNYDVRLRRSKGPAAASSAPQ